MTSLASTNASNTSSNLFPRLAERRSQMAGTMSGGRTAQCSKSAAALMLEAQDRHDGRAQRRPLPLITRMIFENIRRLNQEIGLTVLMIEQNARQGLEASHRGYVLELGRNAYEGEAQALLDNRDVRRAFLGRQ